MRIPDAKPHQESWFAAQLECYKEPMERIFACMDDLGPANGDMVVLVSNELGRASELSAAVHDMYEVVKTCPVVETVVTVPHAAKTMIQTLEALTQDLFDFERIHKAVPKTRKNSINRIDFLLEMAQRLVYLYAHRDAFAMFLKRTFVSLNDTLNTNTNSNNESSFGPMEGGKRRKSKTRRTSRRRKSTRS